MNSTGFLIITFLDLTAATIIFLGALSERMRLYPVWHKVGLLTAVVGLVFQAFHNIQFIALGHLHNETDMPVWVMKDVGLAIIAYTYLYIAIKARLNKPKATPKRRTK